MSIFKDFSSFGALSLSFVLAACDATDEPPYEHRDGNGNGNGNGNGPNAGTYNDGSYNFHLQRVMRFQTVKQGADPDRGRRLFGLAADLETEDTTEALFEGPSIAANGTIVSNGRSCFTCHRGQSERFALPKPPLSEHIAFSDSLFTGLDADAQQDPDGFFNLDQLALVKYRVNRFDPRLDDDDPYKQVFGWRKSIQMLNVGFGHGFLHDMRGRTMFEVARGAVFSHTQDQDARFDDLFTVQDGMDIEAFLFSLVTDERLHALRDPSDPLHATLVNDPFYTVPVETALQRQGQQVFERFCYTCHNTPQVFTAMDNVDPLGSGDRPFNFPAFAPPVGRAYNIGTAELNKHGLRFTHFEPGPNGPIYEPIVIPLAREDGGTEFHTVTFDIGLAMTSGRFEDVGRFKVPQLRNLVNNAPYFHDNSMNTIEEVVDYFNGPHYNNSKDGQRFPINLNAQQRTALIEFLKIL